MKLVTPEEQEAHRRATIKGAFQGGLLSTSIAIPAYLLLQRRSQFYRALPPAAKAFGAVVLILPGISIGAEKSGEAFDRSRWTGVGKREMDAVAERERTRWQGLGNGEKVQEWAKGNKWGIIGSSWAAAMAGSFAIVSQNKYQSFSQKLVQARVYAQGLTVLLLIAAAVASGTTTQEEEVQPAKVDHSWRDILEQEGELDPSDRKAIRQLQGTNKAA